ncbi:hypothetical protein M23134_01537 [Microscilla marina ATCC 23134]|uniref:Uncharacterized protein n=2 Tax=Microscilla marina TaxID=1027 RepID=A1ZK24_MICM2|nr:hypothetical protein M23134_01537 [Microscilla marina ATCC 23134]
MFEPKSEIILSRKEFEQRLNLLIEQGRQRKIVLNADAGFDIKHLTRIRALPNQRIDFATVNELARTTVNALVKLNSLVNDINNQERVDE